MAWAITRLRAEQDRLIEAEQDYQRAIDLEPNHEAAQFALAVCWLSLGRWQQGWPQYEWRWRYAAVNRSRPPRIAPAWDGHSSLQGKRLLLDYEQGYGDCLPLRPPARLRRHRRADLR